MGWAGHVARVEDRRNVDMIFIVGHPRKKRPLGKPKRRGNFLTELLLTAQGLQLLAQGFHVIK